MAESLFDVSVKLIQMGLITLILSILIYRKRKRNLNSLNYLIFIFGMADLQGIIEIAIYFYKVNVLQLENTSFFRFNELHTIPYSLAIFGIYYMSEMMIGMKPNTRRFGIIIGLWASYISVMFFQIFNNYAIVFSSVPASNLFYNTIFDIYQLFALLFAGLIFFNAYRSSENADNRRATFMLSIAVLVYVLVLFYEIGENVLGFTDIYGALTFSLTFIIIAVIYLKYPYYVFTTPVNIYRLVLNTSGGLHLYSADIGIPQGSSSDELLSSGVTAITNVIQQALGSSGSLEYANFGDKSLIVHQRSGLIAFILADHRTKILDSAIRQFMKEFIEKFATEIKDISGNLGQFAGTNHMIAQCFPFVESKDIIRVRSEIQ